MADLPAAVADTILTEAVLNGQAASQNARNIAGIASGVLQAAAARNFDELGTVESRANSGIIGTPVAGPTNPAANT